MVPARSGKGNVKAAAFFGLMESTTDGAGPLAAPWTIDTLLSADDGDGGGAWLLSLMAQVAFPSEQLWGDVAAVARIDAAYARRYFAAGADGESIIGTPGADLIWAGGELVDAWPATPDENDYAQVRDSKVETLLIGGNLDFATPPQWATRDLLPHLPNGHQVVLHDLGHSDDFWTYQPEAGKRLINTYLETGTVDDSLYTGTPWTSPRLQPRRGREDRRRRDARSGGADGALAPVDGPPRAQARRLRPQGERALRTLYPIVLGLGGWFLGVLIVLVAFPTVPLDDQVLAVLSVGVPIGLGIYWAWVDGDWSGKTKITGLVAAAGGAADRSVARVPRDDRHARRRHHDHRRGCRCEPDPHHPGHRMGSGGSRSLRRDRGQRDPGSAPRLIAIPAPESHVRSCGLRARRTWRLVGEPSAPSGIRTRATALKGL